MHQNANSRPKRKLRNFLIYPRFQLGLIAAQALIVTGICVIVELENRAAFSELLRVGREAGLDPNRAYFHFIERQSSAFMSHTLLAFVIGLLISTALTIVISFRLAGPIYHLRKYLRQISDSGVEGLEPLRFRKGDFYSDLPPIVNSAVERLKKH
jgi:hypothetical protein